MANNIITAAYSSSNITYTKPAYQYDYGMILKFSGIELPQAYEVHFSNTEFCGESISQIGDETGVTIPDEMFLNGNPIYAWTYLHTGEDDGETVYKAVISVNKRAKPSDLEPTPVQQDAITQAIAALNVAVEQTAADVVAAGESAEAAAGSAETAGQAKDDAVEAKDNAVEAKNAAETAQGKAEDAQRAAEQAAGSVLGLTADATVDANVGTPSVSVSVITESDHKNMSFAFHNIKGVQGDTGVGISSVVLNADYTLTITLTNGTSYTTTSIRGEVGATPNLTIGTVSTLPEGSQATATITGTDEDPVLNLGIPVGDTGDPGISPTITVTEISGGHEVEVVDAEGTQTFDVLDGEVSEEQLESALIDKADVITSSASGEIVTIADGGNNLPVVDLSLSLLPVQDLHGQSAPYPAGGGLNLRAGIDLANDIKTKVPSATIDTTAKTVSFDYDAEQTSGLYFPIYQYKENTRYTFIITVFNQTIGRTNLRLYYTDSSYTDLPDITANTKQTIAVVSSANKTVLSFSLRKQGGRTVIYYDEWATLEGVHTVSDFAPYENICPISGWTGVDVTRTGKNLFEPTTDSSYKNVDGYAFNGYDSQPIKNLLNSLPVGRYTLSFKFNVMETVSGATSWGILLHNSVSGYEDGGQTAQHNSGETLSFSKSFSVTATNKGMYDHAYLYSGGGNRAKVYWYNFQIELGQTATAFETCQSVTLPISWQSTAGTVYGGSLDVTTGVLTVDKGIVDMGTLEWRYSSNGYFTASVTDKKPYASLTNYAHLMCECYAFSGNYGFTSRFVPDKSICNRSSSGSNMCMVNDTAYTDATAFTMSVTGQHLVFDLETNLEYQLDPVQIQTLLGLNNFWSNGNGELSLEYRADTKLYIEQLTKPTEDDMTANQNITASSFFMVGNRLFLSTVAIAQGATIIPGTNCTEISLADALNQINA